MIPEELHLRNFLSHRETDLDLRGVHIASLVGDNGAGKSALLDAITWVVWGRSRAPYGHDEDLVYHGESGLEVEFIFRMPYQGGTERRFRILRRREQQSRRSSNSLLDLQMESDSGWVSLTADSIRETQARIIKQLGLDYDTFINSAYLRQGHADEFTIQTPTERKRVLSTILGLDRWSEYQDRVKKQLATTQGQIREVDRRLDETTQELARRPEYEEQLQTAEAQAKEAETQRQAIQSQVDEITRVQEQALALQRQIADLNQRLAQEEERLSLMQHDEEQHQGQLTYYQDLVAHADVIETHYRAYQEALIEDRTWGEKLSQSARLQAAKASHEQAIAQVRESLTYDLRRAEQQQAHLEQKIASARAQLENALSDIRGQIGILEEQGTANCRSEQTAQLEIAQIELARLEALAQAQDEARATLQAAEVEQSRLNERNRQLREQMNETKTRLDALARAEALCPLCRQPLTPEHQAQMIAEIRTEGTAMGDEYRANLERVRVLQETQEQLQPQIKSQEQQLKMRRVREQQVARLQQQVEQSTVAQTRAEELRARAAALEQQIAGIDYAPDAHLALVQVQEEKAIYETRLEQGDYAAEARAALAQILAQLAEVGYDGVRHDQVKAGIQALSTADTDYRELEKARVGIQAETEALKRIAGEITAQQARMDAIVVEHTTRQQEIDALQPQLAEGPRLLQLLNTARQQEAVARQRVGAARQNLAALETLGRRLGTLREQRETLARRAGILTELRDAFGVNGIPAMIIEHTLPELEREANRILQQLTNGRMHVRFETQRETKTGNVRETLDIVISDEKGSRPYENFSGGEKFRANFAIRVALSRLLAQRSGVRLRTLFVDEGFGSLDADGRRRLVESVKAVQRDFDMILVITHIDELREAFPTHIQVVKTEAGSIAEVV
ncbi:MAG: SMC family ATPase [Anaerolineae bacterium]|nr:SMC family ATPase [Anaerolineae bacterium]